MFKSNVSMIKEFIKDYNYREQFIYFFKLQYSVISVFNCHFFIMSLIQFGIYICHYTSINKLDLLYISDTKILKMQYTSNHKLYSLQTALNERILSVILFLYLIAACPCIGSGWQSKLQTTSSRSEGDRFNRDFHWLIPSWSGTEKKTTS